MSKLEIKFVEHYERDRFGVREVAGYCWQIWSRNRPYAKSWRLYGSRSSAKAAADRFIDMIRGETDATE